ncbi:hypothetical protein WN51_03936 [Melipona quadrifasciata]|uniref:Uncharacterized protein n=1 Tax=Melipona quadrifasciata TaxID=166423 RepID=A0A0M8ZPG8_9HYME|nr:hypothetical protein WN51_03936 [Melipona quadrifasciata]
MKEARSFEVLHPKWFVRTEELFQDQQETLREKEAKEGEQEQDKSATFTMEWKSYLLQCTAHKMMLYQSHSQQYNFRNPQSDSVINKTSCWKRFSKRIFKYPFKNISIEARDLVQCSNEICESLARTLRIVECEECKVVSQVSTLKRALSRAASASANRESALLRIEERQSVYFPIEASPGNDGVDRLMQNRTEQVLNKVTTKCSTLTTTDHTGSTQLATIKLPKRIDRWRTTNRQAYCEPTTVGATTTNNQQHPLDDAPAATLFVLRKKITENTNVHAPLSPNKKTYPQPVPINCDGPTSLSKGQFAFQSLNVVTQQTVREESTKNLKVVNISSFAEENGRRRDTQLANPGVSTGVGHIPRKSQNPAALLESKLPSKPPRGFPETSCGMAMFVRKFMNCFYEPENEYMDGYIAFEIWFL